MIHRSFLLFQPQGISRARSLWASVHALFLPKAWQMLVFLAHRWLFLHQEFQLSESLQRAQRWLQVCLLGTCLLCCHQTHNKTFGPPDGVALRNSVDWLNWSLALSQSIGCLVLAALWDKHKGFLKLQKEITKLVILATKDRSTVHIT